MSYRTITEEIASLEEALEDMHGLVSTQCQQRVSGRLREAREDLRRGRQHPGQLTIGDLA